MKIKIIWAIVALVLFAGTVSWLVVTNQPDEAPLPQVETPKAEESLGTQIYDQVKTENPLEKTADPNPFSATNTPSNPLKDAYKNPFE